MKKRLLRTCAGILAAMMLMETAFAGNMSARVYADELGPVQEEVLDEASVDEIQALAEEETEEVVTEEVAEEVLEGSEYIFCSIYFDTLGGTLATDNDFSRLKEARYDDYIVSGSKTIRQVIKEQYDFAYNVSLGGMETIENWFIPVKTGYEFVGWVDSEGNAIDFDASLTGDVYCYAKWNAKKTNSLTISIKGEPEEVHNYDVIDIETPEPGAYIYYSINDSNVSANSTPYTGEFSISDIIGRYTHEASFVIYAVAIKNGCDNAYANYTVNVVPDWGDITDYDRINRFGNNINNVDKGLWIYNTDIPDEVEYKGANYTFEDIKVYYGTKLLEEGKNYDISYVNNRNAYELKPGQTGFDYTKMPALVITCKGIYVGEFKKYFNITKIDINRVDIDSLSVLYNGAVQYVIPTITYNKRVVRNGIDFTLAYPETAGSYKNVGEYDIKITGKGNFYGVRYVKEKITSKTLVGAIVEGISDLEFNPNYEEGDLRYWAHEDMNKPYQVTKGSSALKYGRDYITRYVEDAPKIGKTKVKLIGINDYSGVLEFEYDIISPSSGDYIDIKKCVLKNQINEFEYNALPCDQSGDLQVWFGTTQLIYDQDYTIEVKDDGNNIDVGEVTLVIKAKQSPFYGEKEFTFRIVPRKLGNKVTINAGNDAVLKDGEAKNEISLSFAGSTLVEGRDYKLTYTNNTHTFSATQLANPANVELRPTATIVGKGNYSGTVKRYFTIIGDNFSTVRVLPSDKLYKSEADNYKTSVVVADAAGNVLRKGTDYEKEIVYTYVDDTYLSNGEMRYRGEKVKAGDIVPYDTWMRVTVTPIGAYKRIIGQTVQNIDILETISATYKVMGLDIATANVYIPPQRYNGHEINIEKNQIVLMYGTRVLSENEYEIVSYSKNIDVGTAKIVIRGKNDFGGVKEATFSICAGLVGGYISFNGNGATSGSVKSQLVTSLVVDKKPVKLSANLFARTNYKFVGWNTESDGSGESVAPNIPLQDIQHLIDPSKVTVFYAMWQPIQYSITVHKNGGLFDSSLIPSTYTAETELHPISVPDISKWPKGYMFGGWYKDAAYTKRINDINKGTSGDMHLYAKWIPYTFTVKYDPHWPGKEYTTKMADLVISYSEEKALSTNVFKVPGYVFAGWSEDPEAIVGEFKNNAVVSVNSFSSIKEENNINQTVTLYAIWRKVFYVEFEENGGDEVDNIEYTYGVGTKLPTPVREGYTFAGWYTNATLKTKLTSVSTTAATDYILYAKWTPNKYTVIFNKNANSKNLTGAMSNLAMTYDVEKPLPANKFIFKGMKFLGWAYSPAGPVAFEDGESISNVSALNGGKVYLYAQWEETDYSISYEENGGIITSVAPFKYHFGEALALPTIDKEGYVFKGWYKDSNYKSRIKSIANTQYGDLTLYALWAADSKLAVGREFPIDVVMDPSFTWNGPEIPSSYTYGDVIPFPSGVYAPERDGYTFVAWYKDPAFKTKITGITAKTYDDIKVYARWNPKSYTVKYILNKPSEVDSKMVTGKDFSQNFKFEVSTALKKNGFKIKGYTFQGWALEPEGEVVYSDQDKISGIQKGDNWEYGNVSLYAVWKKDIYNITYMNVTGIYNLNPEKYDVYDAFTLYEPECIGRTFIGWYSDATLKKKVTNIAKGTTGDKILYAKWTKTVYNFIYNRNDNNDENTVVYGGLIGYVTNYFKRSSVGDYILPTARRLGYKFKGWSTSPNGTNPVFSYKTAPTIDTVLYATWEAEIYKITYDYGYKENNVDKKIEKTYSISKKTRYLEEPIRYGYVFGGWHLDSINGEVVETIEIDQVGDMKLFASWSPIKYNIIFSLNGAPGTPPAAMNDIYANTTVTLPNYYYSWNGMTFAGWSVNGKKFLPGEKVNAQKIGAYTSTDFVFRAIWK